MHRFGQRRRDAEEFVNSFQDVFFMQQRRVMGDSIRLLKCYEGKWQVHAWHALDNADSECWLIHSQPFARHSFALKAKVQQKPHSRCAIMKAWDHF